MQSGRESKLLTLFREVKSRVHEALGGQKLSSLAKEQVLRDSRGLQPDRGIDATIEACLKWSCRAQDMSLFADGGAARVYSLNTGWSSSYPETTGYIIPTLLECARRTGSADLRNRALRMLQWLKSIQMQSGAFQGGKIDSSPVVPVAFNTGQILFGLVSGETEFGDCRRSLRHAADWLLEIQDPDGCWRKYSSPFTRNGEKTYDTHTAWALLEAERIDPNRGYAEGALANVRWAIRHQSPNGWMDKCALGDPAKLLTHTLGYALRGIVEAYRFSKDEAFLNAARITADSLLTALRDDGFLPGMLWPDWSSAAKWVCLTGSSQIAICWFLLFEATGDDRYLQAGRRANSFVRRTVKFDGPVDIVGGVSGSFPINGGYSRYEYPNWAAKFLIDSLLLEKDFSNGSGRASSNALITSDNEQL